MAKSFPFFQEKDDKVIFVGNYMEIYMPRFYFDNEISNFVGDKVETIGVFNFKVFSGEDKKGVAPLHTFSYPSYFVTCPSSSKNEKVDLIADVDDNEFVVLQYFKGDVFIDNVNVAKNSAHTLMFINLLHSGKIPATVPYDKVLGLELDNLAINGVNLGVSATIMELVISEIYRDKKDMTKSFRFRAGGTGKVSMFDYRTINLKAIANFNSTFTGVTFEDMDFALVSSVNKLRSGKKEAVSPIEKTIKY